MSDGHTARLQLWPMPYVSTVCAVRQHFVTDLASPAHVVEYLERVASDEALYNFHHAWREPAAYAAWAARFAKMHPDFAPGVLGFGIVSVTSSCVASIWLRLKTDATYLGPR